MSEQEEREARIEENFREIDAQMMEIREAEANWHRRRLIVWSVKHCAGIAVCYSILMYFFH